jgi:uncharacterized membrane protein required for colicin V production
MSIWFDIVLIFLLLGGIAAGFAMGLFRQIVNVLALLFAFVFASYYQPNIARFVRERLGEEEGFGRDALVYFLVFLAIWLFINFGVAFSFRSPPRFLPGTLDRLAGMVVGVASGTILVVIITLLLNYATTVTWPRNDELRVFINEGINASTIRGLLFAYVPEVTEYLEPLLPRGLPAFFSEAFFN